MKKLIIFGLMCIALTVGYAQNLFRYVNNERHYFEVCTDRVVILVNERMTEGAIESSLQRGASLQVSEMSSSNKFRLVSFRDGSQSVMNQLAGQWKSNDTILFVGQVIVDEVGQKTAALTNQINVRLKNDGDFAILQKAVAFYGIYKIEQDEFDSRSYLLVVCHLSEKSALEIANRLHQTGLFEFAEPNLLLFIQYTANNAYFQYQWGLRNTGQSGGTPGVDIRAQQAWSITTGSPDVRVAILDAGVDLSHTSLTSSLIPGLGFDATGGGNSGNHSGYAHGTAVAGIVAARGNIAGVAYRSTILPVHVGDIPLANQVVAGINWAIANNARVINMSFITTYTQAVITALNNATAAEIVLVAASGNNNAPAVSFPASLNNVIAVGAISQCGERKSPTSCDRIWGWGSNFGTALNVVAPGVLIPTTDIQGSAGYTTEDYVMSFGGTSAAAPHVAGVAALILSVRPDLTAQDVQTIIEMSAQKLPGMEDNQNFMLQYGYGLVNAYAALRLVESPNEIFHWEARARNPIRDHSNRTLTLHGGVGGLAAGAYIAHWYWVSERVTFPTPFMEVPAVWVRDRHSNTMRYGNPNDGLPWARITNVTTTGFDVQYAAYFVIAASGGGGDISRWIPADRHLIGIAYTAIGIPAPMISGPAAITPPSCQAQFTVNNLPPGTITNAHWTSSSPALLRNRDNGINGSTFVRAANLSNVDRHADVRFHFHLNGQPFTVSRTIRIHNHPYGLEVVRANTHNAVASP